MRKHMGPEARLNEVVAATEGALSPDMPRYLNPKSLFCYISDLYKAWQYFS